MTAAGGQRYTPLDLEQSQAEGRSVYQDDIAFSEQFKDYFRLDLRVAYRMDFKKASQEFAVDIQNLTNRINVLAEEYNPETQSIREYPMTGFLPILNYRLEF
jgi:hypothetical protein